MRALRTAALSAAAVATLALVAGPAWGESTVVTVSAGAESGVSAGVTLSSGDTVTITASGTARTVDWQPPTDPDGRWPDGGSASCVGIAEVCLAQTAASALVGKVGNGEWTLIGKGPTELTGLGPLWLAYNDAIGYFGDNSGSYLATLNVTRAADDCSKSVIGRPLAADGSSAFKLGSTIPLKFACSNGSLTPALSVQRASGGTSAVLDKHSGKNAKAGSEFRYDPTAGQYIHNLSTKGLTEGRYVLRVTLGHGAALEARITLR